jgi:C4-dicarboxylate transporter, DctQ subunit
MSKLGKALTKIENFIMGFMFSVMIVAAFAQVINRNITHAGIGWFEELARYSMIWMTLFATEIGLRDGTQISITAATDRFSKSLQKLAAILANVFVVGFAAVCFYFSIAILETQRSSGQLSPGMGIPMYIPYFALTLGCGAITVTQSIRLCGLVFRLDKPEVQAKE